MGIWADVPLRVQVLGPVRAWQDGRELELGSPKQRGVLALLAANANRVVLRDDLVDALWGEALPTSAVNAAHVYIAGLRRVLEPGRGHRQPGQLLVSAGSGYLLRLAAGQLDADVFDQLFAQAREFAAAGDQQAAVRSFDQALGLWRGAPLSGIPGPFADAERARLAERQLVAAEERAAAMLALGEHPAMLTELPDLIRKSPLRESLRGLLMLALYRSGRQSEALASFRDTRRLLVEELGVEPGAQLRRLHQQMLAADPALELAAALPAASQGLPVHARRRPVFQLPHDVAGFTGFRAELARLRSTLTQAASDPGSDMMTIFVVDGMAGAGKSALAVHFAHQVADRFADGQLYVDLRGFARARPLESAEALRQVLHALGVNPTQVPQGLDERTGMYRTLLKGTRTLVLVDNAATAEQARPLLPGEATCLVLVTSRNRLSGLVSRDGAHRITLGVLAPEEAVTLMAGIIGEPSVTAEPDAAAEVARLAGYLPLAVRVAVGYLGAHPSLSFADLASEMAPRRRRLDVLSADDDQATALRALFSWSYQVLLPAAARAFRLLGLHVGAEISTPAAAALTGHTHDNARQLLETLASIHQLESVGRERYRIHELLRIYAVECLDTHESAPGRAHATRRVLSWYLHTADAADRAIAVRSGRVTLSKPMEFCAPLAFSTHREALGWFKAERTNLVAATSNAADTGLYSTAWKLPVALWGFLNQQACWFDWITTHRVGLAAARRLRNLRGQALTLIGLCVPLQSLRRFGEAVEHSGQALAIFREMGDRWGEAMSLTHLGNAYSGVGRFGEAVEHSGQALATFREIGDRYGEAVALEKVGEALNDGGRSASAREVWHRSLAILEDLGADRVDVLRARLARAP